METPAPEAPERRRFLLCLLALGGGAGLAAARFVCGPSFRLHSLQKPVERADRAVAELAADFARSQPGRARRMARAVESGFSATERRASRARRLAAARARLLDAERIDAELATGDVMLLNGWVLARSEAEYAIYAHVEPRA